MAVVDGYVAATRLMAAVKKDGGMEDSNIPQALKDYDSKRRRKENKVVIMKARKYGRWACSNNRFTIWATHTAMMCMSPSAFIGELTSGDKSNKLFLAAMKRDLES